MSENEKKSLLDLFSKKLNFFITITLSVLGIFIALFVTFMIKSSNNNGIQDTQIAQMLIIQEQTLIQVEKISKATNLLLTEKEVKEEQYNNLLELVRSTNNMAKKTEWAVLTGDKSIITRDKKE